MPIYYEAKTLDRAIDAAPRITPSTKSVLKKIIRSAPQSWCYVEETDNDKT